MRSRNEAKDKGSNGGSPQRLENNEQIPRRHTRRRRRTLQAKRAEKIMKDKVRELVRKNKAKHPTQHGAVRGDGGIKERKRTT